MDGADLVGYIVGEHPGGTARAGNYLYACDEHTPDAKREDHRQLLRDEAEDVAAFCENCGLELWEAEGINV